jgi:hypothetical protein
MEATVQTTTTPPSDLLAAIEQHWLGRAKMQNMPGPTSLTYKKAEIEFFAGAMAALDAGGFTIPAKWVMAAMSGRNVVTP